MNGESAKLKLRVNWLDLFNDSAQGNGETPPHIRAMEKDLASAVKQIFSHPVPQMVGYSIVGNPVRSILHSNYGEKEVEQTYTLECQKNVDWHRWLMQLLKGLLAAIPSEVHLTLKPRISVPKEVFANSIITETHPMECRAVYFGSFVQMKDCSLLSHYEVSFLAKEDLYGKSVARMTVSFVHDCNHIAVRFDNYERNFQQKRTHSDEDFGAEDSPADVRRTKSTRERGRGNGEEERECAFYTLKVFYKHIVRIVVDINDKVVRIHLVVQNPVIVHRITESQMVEIIRRRETPGEGRRIMSINRGRVERERPRDGILADCRVFTMELPTSSKATSEAGIEETIYQWLHSVLGAVSHRCNIPIHFAKVKMGGMIISNHSKLAYYKPFADRSLLQEISQMMWNRWSYSWYYERTEDDEVEEEARKKREMFPLFYLIECLLSRGCAVKDQICRSEQSFWEFFLPVLRCYRADHIKCQQILERLVDLVSNYCIEVNLSRAFHYLMDKSYEVAEDVEKHLNEQDFVKVRKIVVTPTRRLLLSGEEMMGNLIIRKYGGDGGNDIIRVSFRDDDNTQMRANFLGDFIGRRVRDVLLDPNNEFMVGGYQYSYLGNSNSQLRDHGCYFIRGDSYKAQLILRAMGKFDLLSSVPKMVSRVGMCFTQSRCITHPLHRWWYRKDGDIIGGNDSNGEPYTFSDGVGRISEFYMEMLMAHLRMGDRFLPSCIQFRFPGAKGVVTLDPVLDRRRIFALEMGFRVCDEREGVSPQLRVGEPKDSFPAVVFRDSQFKFVAPVDNRQMEMVKYSAPTQVALNRPFINILDQVSALQSADCHRRMCNRIEDLLDKHVKNCGRSLLDEHAARSKLKELPHRFDVDRLPSHIGFHLSCEPFFRSLVYATVKYSMMKQLIKLQIPIPEDLGRTMFGVVDDSGLLQSGQVFVQYSIQCKSKVSKISPTKIHTGPVLLTKNPCIVAGDVRLFEAVDVPALYHLKDVVVFPQHGPRPHPDEMAGSDLDGDEYSVIWDKELFFERNETPMDFTKAKAPVEDLSQDLRKKVIDFYIRYMMQDQVGIMANGHLINSDLYGIQSKVAHVLAQKHSEAVDFPKTGIPPGKLTKSWTKEKGAAEDEEKTVPPERANRMPDFMERDHLPYYTSQGLIGRVYRECKFILDMLQSAEEKLSQTCVTPDPMLDCPHWKAFEQHAEEEYQCYSRELQREMEHYGVNSEAELLTGCLMDPKNRVSDRDNDDMSFYNTSHTVKEKVTLLWTTFRKRFFEQENKVAGVQRVSAFGRYEDLTSLVESPYAEERNPLHRHIMTTCTPTMKAKAIAYYKVAYREASSVHSASDRILSFPWLVWDILAQVRRDRFNELSETETHRLLEEGNPFQQGLRERVREVHEKKSDEVKEYHKEYILPYDSIRAYTKKNMRLCLALFVLNKWAERNDIFSQSLRPVHLAMIAIMCGKGEFADSPMLLEELAADGEENGKAEVLDVAPFLISFLQTVRSRRFANMEMVDFSGFNLDSILFGDQLTPLHEAAKRTYLNIVFSGKLDELCLGEQEHLPVLPEIISEEEPFTIELPPNVDACEVQTMLMEKCHLVEVRVRKIQDFPGNENRYRVSARGTMKNLRLLKHKLSVDPVQLSKPSEKIELMYAERTLSRIREDE